MTCVNRGIIFRIALTIITLHLSPNNLLVLPILLLLLDEADNIFIRSNKTCTKTFNYQIKDKITDVLSYLYAYTLFSLDVNVLYFTLYRLIGVILFYLTKSSIWLIVFFDFVKEYMVYTYFFENNYMYLVPCIFIKIIFECIWHLKVNTQSY